MLKAYRSHPLILTLLVIVSIKSYGETKRVVDSVVLFQNVVKKLSALKTISYQYNQEFTYPLEDYHYKSGGEMYIDFGKENDLVGFKYQYINSDGFSIFNNTSLLEGNFKNKTIKTTKLLKSSFEGKSPLYNSIVTLRNVLPLIIGDVSIKKKVSDTLINKKLYYVLSFDTHNKLPNYLGTGFTSTTKEMTFYNRLIVDKATLLPVIMLQNTKGSMDLNRTDFINIHVNPVPPKEASWYYSSYLSVYQPEKQDSITIIKPNSIAPELLFKNYQNGSQESLSKYHGRLILLEFWIKNCSYCIEAVSKLNDLNSKYAGDTFQLLAINSEDSEESIKSFIRKNRVNYTVFLGDDINVKANYGIAAFPQVVLINKDGIVIYSGKLDTEKISSLIENNI